MPSSRTIAESVKVNILADDAGKKMPKRAEVATQVYSLLSILSGNLNSVHLSIEKLRVHQAHWGRETFLWAAGSRWASANASLRVQATKSSIERHQVFTS